MRKENSYKRAMELCSENDLTPLFSYEDWLGYRSSSDSVDYPVKCRKCGNQYNARFRSTKVTKCSCSNKNITRLDEGKSAFIKALESEGLQLLEEYTQASINGKSIYYKVRCSKCGRQYKTYWKSGQIIHCGCRPYLKALEVCSKQGLTPLFSREDWSHPEDRVKYLVRCGRCGNSYYAVFHGDRVSQCPCGKSRTTLNKSYRDTVMLLEEQGLEPLFTREEWNGYRPVSSETYLKYRVRCKSCGSEFETTFSTGFVAKCSCKKVWQWRSHREERVAKWIEDQGIKVIRNCRTLIKTDTGNPMELDLYLPDLGIAFEFNGYQFHCSSLSEYAKPKEYHKVKTDRCLEKGVKLYHIWEDTPDYLCDSIIRSKLGLLERIPARKCSIVKLPNDWFADKHIDGECVSPTRFGLSYEGRIVCGISIRYSNGYAEIARYACELGVSVVGGFTKLLKYVKGVIQCKTDYLVSFCNRDIAPDLNNTVYHKCGFEYLGFHLSYKYYNQKKGREVVSRQSMTHAILKERLSSLGMPCVGLSEEDMAMLLGYSRVYNSGNFKFGIHLSKI